MSVLHCGVSRWATGIELTLRYVIVQLVHVHVASELRTAANCPCTKSGAFHSFLPSLDIHGCSQPQRRDPAESRARSW